MSGHFHQKWQCDLVAETLMLSAWQKWTPSLTSFLRYCKDNANLLLWVIWECLIMANSNDSITLKETLMLKNRNQLVENFDVSLHAKNQFPLQLLFWDVVKTWQTYYFGNFGNAWRSPSKIIVPICRKLSFLSACKKITFIPRFFWKYCKDMQTSYFRIFGHAWLCTPKM